MGKGKMSNQDRPPLDRYRADSILMPNRPIWGADAIGGILGVSGMTVKRWVKDPQVDIPVGKVGGRYMAKLAELVAWERGKRVS